MTTQNQTGTFQMTFGKLTRRLARGSRSAWRPAPSLACPRLLKPRSRWVLNWKYQGPQGMFFLAQDRGYFKAEGLDVTFDQGNGSGAAVRWWPTAPMTWASAT